VEPANIQVTRDSRSVNYVRFRCLTCAAVKQLLLSFEYDPKSVLLYQQLSAGRNFFIYFGYNLYHYIICIIHITPVIYIVERVIAGVIN